MTVEKQVSLHGGRVALSPEDELLSEKGFISGGGTQPAIALPSPFTVAVFEDFMGRPTKGDTGNTTSGHADRFGDYFIAARGDSGNVIAQREAPNGIIRLTSSVGTGTPDGIFCGLTGPIPQWKANQGGPSGTGKLRMGCRLRIADIAKMGVLFCGFTDVVGAEFPIFDTGIAGTDTGTNFVSTAKDAVGIHFGLSGDTGWVAMAVANDVDRLEVPLTPGVAPASATWITLETEIRRGAGDTGGVAYFYIDGQLKGSIISPITSSVGLTPIVSIADHSAQTAVLDVDWMAVSGPRDSGE